MSATLTAEAVLLQRHKSNLERRRELKNALEYVLDELARRLNRWVRLEVKGYVKGYGYNEAGEVTHATHYAGRYQPQELHRVVFVRFMEYQQTGDITLFFITPGQPYVYSVLMSQVIQLEWLDD